jgi:DNA-binding NarL/FixJ family response regulator
MKKMKILMLEDNELYSTLIKQLFITYNDIEVVNIITGQECLDIIDVFNPNILIIDHLLIGKMDGLETLTKIIDKKSNPYIIVLSGQSDMDVVISYYDCGIDKYIKKGDDSIVKLIKYIEEYYEGFKLN